MASVRRRGDVVRVSLEPSEVSLVIFLSSQVLDLLGPNEHGGEDDSLEELLGAATEAVDRPDDPVLLRLLPDAYSDDDEAAGEFRRLTESDLRASKSDGLSRLVIDLTATENSRPDGRVRVDLDEDHAAAWLPALTDVRLALGVRIGVTDDTEDLDALRDSLDEDSAVYAELVTYDWMSWFQDAIVRALTSD